MSSRASLPRRPRLRWPRQVAAFAQKELAEVIRQPRLLLVMVLGPFAVMAAFGLGYRDSPPRLRTVFVMDEANPMREQVDVYADRIGGFVDYEGVVTDRADADRMLSQGDIDVIVAFPADPLATVRSGERAVVTVVHDRLDPVERSAIAFVSALAIDRINSEVLAAVVTRGQGVGGAGSTLVETAQQDISALRAAVDAGDPEATTAAAAALESSAGGIAVAASLASEVSDRLGEGSDAGEFAIRVQDALAQVRTDVASGADSEEALRRLDDELTTGATTYQELLAIDPHVLVQPLQREVQLAVDGIDHPTDWYAPAAVILMLQQFGVAFGAMSFVRERQLGIDDVYRVAPVGAGGSLLGKYLAYVIVGSIIAAATAALVVGALDVPVAGAATDLVIVMVLTLVASIGLGFIISLLSRSEAQAVQYTMIVLLASLFFSGFFLSLGQMRPPVSWIQYLLPVSAGMRMLRDVMLRGAGLDRQALVALGAYAAIAYVLAYAGVRRRLSPEAAVT